MTAKATLVYGAAVACAAATAVATLSAQRPAVTINDDDITVRGCIRPADATLAPAGSMLFWSRSDIMLAAASASEADALNPAGAASLAGRVFYWLDDEDDLAEHVGQLVEVKGELEDFEKGEVKIDRDDDFTEIELDLGGKEEHARVPTSWLDSGDSDEDHQFDIVARRVDVKDVHVVGDCR